MSTKLLLGNPPCACDRCFRYEIFFHRVPSLFLLIMVAAGGKAKAKPAPKGIFQFQNIIPPIVSIKQRG